ncbi:MAG: hypothetical protein M1368_05080 [Thaumarchaeota archaeon]|nr:hypothetical protein [Nitrososphaerota archaeon]
MKNRNAAGVVAVVSVIVVASITLYYATVPATQRTVTTTVTINERSLLTADPEPYFPIGYNSERVNLTNLQNGTNVIVGVTNFRFSIPSNIETRTTTIGGVSTVITVTADYQCGISLGQRLFFFAQLQNGNEFRLDYCLLLNYGVQLAQRSNNLSMIWSLWQISLNTSPTVSIHMVGMGESVNLVELCVSK